MWDDIIGNAEPLTLERGDDRVVLEYWDGGRKNLFFDQEDPLDSPCWHLAHYRCNEEGHWELLRGFRTRFNLSTETSVLTCWLGTALQRVRTGGDAYEARLRETGAILDDPEDSPEAWLAEPVGAGA